MKQYFDELSHQVSKATTEKYSTSFSLGILALHPAIRKGIYAIYGYVRLADEIVDSFHAYDKPALLQSFKTQTEEALNAGISLNPILHSFQETVLRYQIDRALIDQFLHSMEMDLAAVAYNNSLYEEYILGSAEVVGLMCLKVFTEGHEENYETLKPFAMKLGAAFQKINFLRDLKDDYQVLGRSYFPNINLEAFDQTAKDEIEKEIAQDFALALQGIRQLPVSSRFGVYLAYKYYLSLFKKIKKLPAASVLNQRIRIPNTQKFGLMMQSYVQFKMALL